MEIFQLLGIEKTDNTKEIKRAYAKKLKKLDLEKDPILYQELREAYKSALYYAKSHQEDEDNLFELKEPNLDEIVIEQPLGLEEWQFDEVEIQPQLRNSFQDKWDQFIDKGTYFSSVLDWKAFLFQAENSSLDEYIELKKKVRMFLNTNYGILSDDVRDIIVKILNLEEEYQSDYFNYHFFKDRILKKNFLDFDCYTRIEKSERQDYFELRNQLYQWLNEKNGERTTSFIGTPEMNKINQLSYLDDDFYFLLACAYLFEDKEKLPMFYSQINNQYLDKITNKKYQQDILYIKRYLKVIVYKGKSSINKNEQFYLKWLPYDLKKKIGNDVYWKQGSQVPVNKEKKSMYKIFSEKLDGFNYEHPGLAMIIVLALLVGIIYLVGYDGREMRTDQEIINEYSIDLTAEQAINKREINQRITPAFYNAIFSAEKSDQLDLSQIKMSTDGEVAYDKYVDKLGTLPENIKNQTKKNYELRERHFLTESNTVVTLTEIPTRDNFFVETEYNLLNELDNIKITTRNAEFDIEDIGTYDTVSFLFQDVKDIEYSKKSYQLFLSEIGALYFSEDMLNKMINNLSEKQYRTLRDFSTFDARLIDENLIEVVNSDNKKIHLELNRHNQIIQIYGENFQSRPEEIIFKMVRTFDQEYNKSPWENKLGEPEAK